MGKGRVKPSKAASNLTPHAGVTLTACSSQLAVGSSAKGARGDNSDLAATTPSTSVASPPKKARKGETATTSLKAGGITSTPRAPLVKNSRRREADTISPSGGGVVPTPRAPLEKNSRKRKASSISSRKTSPKKAKHSMTTRLASSSAALASLKKRRKSKMNADNSASRSSTNVIGSPDWLDKKGLEWIANVRNVESSCTVGSAEIVIISSNEEMETMRKKGWTNEVILIKSGVDSGVIAPQESVEKLIGYIGRSKQDAINCFTQENENVPGSTLLDMWKTKPEQRESKYNVLGLELSKQLKSKFAAPILFNDASLAREFWSANKDPSLKHDPRLQRPGTDLYTLITPEKSFTNFHIDFSGSATWLHLREASIYTNFHGQKTFILIPPTPENLDKFEEWSLNRDSCFLGDLLNDQCLKITLNKDDTVLLPAGWMHCVYTPQDSVAFSGSALTRSGMVMQLEAYAMENRTNVLNTIKFPFLEQMFWTLAPRIIKELKEITYIGSRRCSKTSSKMTEVVSRPIEDATILLYYLKKWMENDFGEEWTTYTSRSKWTMTFFRGRQIIVENLEAALLRFLNIKQLEKPNLLMEASIRALGTSPTK